MNAYDDEQTSPLDALLVRREAELRSLLASVGTARVNHADAQSAHEVTDFKEAANDEAAAVVNDFQAGHAAQELQQVVDARKRLNQGEYGHCQSCGQAISLSRLLALPAAALCTACQAQQEQRRHN